jgi:coproporphyrinogen III oxidase
MAALYSEQKSIGERAVAFFRKLQDEITSTLEMLDGKEKFFEEHWERPGGGGGRTRVLAEGNIFEKAGVNFSAVSGEAPPYLHKQGMEDLTFFASGISLVLHPRSPMVPTIHANFRFFSLSNGASWFGGGIDLTPYYLDEEDAVAFHTKLKTVCDKHDPTYYPKFKKWCDEYFFIKHRGETRGIGGIFFDHLSGTEKEMEKYFDFVQDVGENFLRLYVPIVEKHKGDSYSEREKHWQLLRRGRYVEFNLVYDKGTLFGLETNGRIESILMSLPTVARWEYNATPELNSPEEKLINVLKSPREWAHYA